MKEYFPHDFNARTDPKLQNVMMDMGMAGIGLYWCLIEQLYDQGGAIALSDVRAIAFNLHVEKSMVEQLINDYDLFETDGVMFWSPAIEKRIGKRKEESEKKRQNVLKRWQKEAEITQDEDGCNTEETPVYNNENTAVIQAEDGCNTIKVNKRKEKEINISLSVSDAQAHTPTCEKAADAAEREKFFEIIFFRNARSPEKEVKAFCDYYEANGWKRSNGAVIQDRLAACRQWKVKEEQRFPDKFLAFWSVVFLTLNEQRILLTDVKGAKEATDGVLTLNCTEKLREVIEQNADKVGPCMRRHYKGIKYSITK